MKLSQHFHQMTKNLFFGRTHNISTSADNAKNWPIEWSQTEYKIYPRLPHFNLPENSGAGELIQLLQNRKSRRNFSEQILTKEEISTLLSGVGNTQPMAEFNNERYHRAYPSAGARFPIETYLILLRAEAEFPVGVYHYNVKKHELVLLKKISREAIQDLFYEKWVGGAAAVFVFTAVFGRNQRKYGDFGYRHVLIEIGHAGQNIYLLSEALRLKCSTTTSLNSVAIEKMLGIDGVTESVVYAIAVGK